MDNGTAILFGLILIAAGAFAAGRYFPLVDVKQDCATKGEFSVQGTIIQCEPIGAWVDGKRILFVEHAQ